MIERFQVVDYVILEGVRGEINEEERKLNESWPLKYPPAVPKWLGGHATPMKNWRTGFYESEWRDESKWRDEHVDRKVIAKHMRETWTDYDPEQAEQTVLPHFKRQRLSK
jgi:hypothetical protein